jgi:8-oxo-dGTP pyrophosphatase MutT (NUDIX family)
VTALSGVLPRSLQRGGQPVPSGYAERRSDPDPEIADALRPALPETCETAWTDRQGAPSDRQLRPTVPLRQGELGRQVEGPSRACLGPAEEPRADSSRTLDRLEARAAHRLAAASPVSASLEGEQAGPVARLTRSGRSRLRNARATSAGGIVVRRGSDGFELVLGRRTRERNGVTWTLPKGQPIEGETLEQTALREVAEETGLAVRIIRPVGRIEYFFVQTGTRFHKTVHFFLMEPTGGDLAAHDLEFEEVRWFGVPEAEALMSYPTERQILEQAVPVMTAVGS